MKTKIEDENKEENKRFELKFWTNTKCVRVKIVAFETWQWVNPRECEREEEAKAKKKIDEKNWSVIFELPLQFRDLNFT